MKRILFILLTITTIAIGCNSKGNSIELITVATAKSNLIERYQKALKSNNDSIITNKINALYFSINSTSEFIDSIRAEMNKLDQTDLTNNDLVKKIFLTDGLADSLFSKVNHSYSLTRSIAIKDETKALLMETKNKYSEETQKQLFSLQNPGGAQMILYGIEIELIQYGVMSLEGY